MDYHRLHAERAMALIRRVAGRRVLVIGCNTGGDCRFFAEAGATVTGIDVIAEVGAEFVHPAVRYVRACAERLPLPDRAFDLVYSVATLEHVHGLEAAFGEMARVTARRGYIYCVSSPLWNSQYGSHKADLFGAWPWAHLRYSPAELLERCERAGMQQTGGLAMRIHVDYIFNPRVFNRRAAADFVAACKRLHGMAALENSLAMDELGPELASVASELVAAGYPMSELLAVTHTYVGYRGQKLFHRAREALTRLNGRVIRRITRRRAAA